MIFITLAVITAALLTRIVYSNITDRMLSDVWIKLISVQSREELVKVNHYYERLTNRILIGNQSYLAEQILHVLKKRNRDAKIVYAPTEEIKFK